MVGNSDSVSVSYRTPTVCDQVSKQSNDAIHYYVRRLGRAEPHYGPPCSKPLVGNGLQCGAVSG